MSHLKAKYKARTDFYKTGDSDYLDKALSQARNALNYLKPKRIDPSTRDSYNVGAEIEFEKLCQGLQEQTPAVRVKDMTVIEFYSKIELLKERQKNR